MRRLFALTYLLPVALFAACGNSPSTNTKCDAESTFGLVQSVFEARGCTHGACHGQPAETAGGALDLRPENAYASLINVGGTSADLPLVFPGEQDLSVLYLKVAAKTLGTELASAGVSGSPMPSSPDMLSEGELELLREWIRGGAPETGIVKDAAAVLGCDASDVTPSPNKIPPLPSPDLDKGLQFYSGAWSLPPESEDEICFVTHYDFADRIPEGATLPCPEEYGGADRNCFAYDAVLLAQDPQSHHAIIESYIPPADKPEQWDPKNEAWKNWQCLGGDKNGSSCDPVLEGECGERSVCATAPATAIGCIGYPNGPREMAGADGFFGNASARQNIVFVQEATFQESMNPGVYGVVPVSGFVIWNSHAFNLTVEETTVEQYLNFTYVDASERLYQRRSLVRFDNIFAMGEIAPFESTETCATFTVEVGTRIVTLSSHTHQHGRDFRIWYPPNERCAGVSGCTPPADRDPDYRSFQYQDPLYQRFGADELIALDDPDPDSRTFRYCAVFDNGAEDPTTVRRNSTRPDAQTCAFAELAGGFISQCGCEPEFRACLGGPNQGAICGDDDAFCGEGGVCDACPLSGGVTTEDEMFVILGAYYVVD
ncbi:MAG: hypothetical protein JRJ24_17580 [Deltaproteobacteria bacterium]|nr:hypothetical protein [Deltaproteobacteria bacterium]